MVYESPDKLISELKDRAKWYCNGFDGLLCATKHEVEIYSYSKGSCYFDRAKKGLQEIVDIQDTIPFEELHGHPDIDVFLYVGERIIRFVEEAEKVLFGTCCYKETEMQKIAGDILDKGEEYNRRMVRLMDKIHTYPGLESFLPVSEDLLGEVWIPF